MVIEWIARLVGRGEHLNVEALEQRSRPELTSGELFSDLRVDRVRRLRCELLSDAEDFVQLVVEPGTGGRTLKQKIVLGEQPP